MLEHVADSHFNERQMGCIFTWRRPSMLAAKPSSGFSEEGPHTCTRNHTKYHQLQLPSSALVMGYTDTLGKTAEDKHVSL